MDLTKEQIEIINSSGDIKINAVAGSGKTTTIIEYAKSRPKQSRILYLVFNKSVKLEAARKFEKIGLDNVKVETAHSLAYKYIVRQNGYKVLPQGYKTNELAELLKLKGNGEKHTEYVVANHINKFISYYCNSDRQKVNDLNYLDTITDNKAKIFVGKFYEYIVNQTRLLLAKMDKGEIDITHDFYLKKFQLSNPQLPYDYILFDEGQDASAAMLDIFLKQKAIKVIVGDTHQQIYGWRFAVNSLEKADFKDYYLSTSFRFGQDIANLSTAVLKLKGELGEFKPIEINGKGNSKGIKTKAVIARTNLGLLLKAIEYVVEKKEVKQIYFEGNINSYTYADDGASLYDVLNLYNGKKRLIKDKLIRSMKDMGDLEDYIKKSEDNQLGMMVEIVKEYENKIPILIKAIKEKHVQNDEKEHAEMIFSTVHRCKGMEYDAVQIVNDFISEEKIKKLKDENRIDETNSAKINEEINLLYVAVTRAKNMVYIPETLLPADFPKSPHIHSLKIISKEEKEQKRAEADKKAIKDKNSEKAYSLDTVRATHKSAYAPWTTELDDELTVMFGKKRKIKEMAAHFGRTDGAIRKRIKGLELEALYG
jgi:F-box protein 18 (helicase)